MRSKKSTLAFTPGAYQIPGGRRRSVCTSHSCRSLRRTVSPAPPSKRTLSGTTTAARPSIESSVRTTCVRRAKFHPFCELAFRAHIFGVDAQPSLHSPPAHLHEASVRRRDERVRLRWVNGNQDPTLTACRHGHVAPDEKREPAEHLLLGQIGFAADQLDALCT